MTTQAQAAPAPQPVAAVAVPTTPAKPMPFSIGALPEPVLMPGDYDPAYHSGCVTVASHSGHCCGISCIYTFPTYPHAVCQSRAALTAEQLQKRNTAAPGLSYNEADYYPRQTAVDRLKTAIHRVETRRPKGIIEVVLTANQTAYWREVLEEIGFKEVNSARNSNSGNTIVVFHKNSGQ